MDESREKTPLDEDDVIEKIKLYTQISPIYNSAVKDHYRSYLQCCAELLKLDFELSELRIERDKLYRRARLAEINRDIDELMEAEKERNRLESQISAD